MRLQLHILFTLLTATLLLLGCSQDDTATRDDSTTTTEMPVFFLASTNDANTRGVAMSGDLNTDTQFRVYATKQRREGSTRVDELQAFINAGSSDDNVVTYKSYQINADNPDARPAYIYAWAPNHSYYWPQDNYYVNFYAIHPATAPAISNILTSKQVIYDSTTPLPGDYDLMYAMVEDTHRDEGPFTSVLEGFGDNKAVSLTFHHLLSRIMFYGKLSKQFADWGWTVEVGGISIHNINGAGTFDFDNVANGLKRAETPVYTNYTLPMNESRQAITTTAVAKDSEGQNIPLTSPTEITAVIPQNPTSWNPATETSGTKATGPSTTGCYLAIQLRAKDASNYYQLGSAEGFTTVYVPFGTGVYNDDEMQISWQAAKTYKYTLEFGGGYDAAGQPVLQPVTISTAIQPWESVTVGGEATHKKTNE